MNYETRSITKRLREARQAKNLSQRDLSRLAGVPQAQISRIEANSVDLRLSSLIAIANALDLEIVLVPHKAVPAVLSITRQTTEQVLLQAPAIVKELQRFQELIRSIQAKVPQIPHMEELRKAYAAIQLLKIDTSYLKVLHTIRAALEDFHASQEEDWATVTKAVDNMKRLRNQIVHAHALPAFQLRDIPKPAYTLDEDDDA